MNGSIIKTSFYRHKLNDFANNINWSEVTSRDRKRLNEEILPLNQYVQAEYHNADNIKVEIYSENEKLYDAYILENNVLVERLQLTCAIHGYSHALKEEALREQVTTGNICDVLADVDEQAEYAFTGQQLVGQERKKLKEDIKSSKQLEMHDAENVKQRQLKLIKEAIDKKIAKNKPDNIEPRTLIVVYYVDGCASYISDFDKLSVQSLNELTNYCKSRSEKLIENSFDKVVICKCTEWIL